MRRRASTFPDRAWAEPPSHLRAYSSSGEKLEDDDSRSWLPVWMPLFHKFASGALRYSKEGCRVVGGGRAEPKLPSQLSAGGGGVEKACLVVVCVHTYCLVPWSISSVLSALTSASVLAAGQFAPLGTPPFSGRHNKAPPTHTHTRHNRDCVPPSTGSPVVPRC